jgi:hypothetical protein
VTRKVVGVSQAARRFTELAAGDGGAGLLQAGAGGACVADGTHREVR